MDKFEAKLRDALKPQQLIFCHAYAANGFREIAKAVRESGYQGERPDTQGQNWLQRKEVDDYLTYLRDKFLFDADIRRDDLIREIKAIGFSNISDFLWVEEVEIISQVEEPQVEEMRVDEGGEMVPVFQKQTEAILRVRPFDSINPMKLRALSEVTHKDGEFRFKMHPKLDALKHLSDIAKLKDGKPDDNQPKMQQKTVIHSLKRVARNPNDVDGYKPTSVPDSTDQTGDKS